MSNNPISAVPPPLETYWVIITTCGDIFHATDETIARRMREADAEYGEVRTAREEGYAPPEAQPHCQCRGNPIAPFACPYGHASACHYPLTCADAACGHVLTAAKIGAKT